VGGGEAVLRGSTDDGEFSVFYVDDGRVVGCLSVGGHADLDEARRKITERAGL